MLYQAQFERLELKYFVNESIAAKVRQAIAPFCAPDAYNGSYGRGYYIGSIYFDSPDLAFFRAKERRDRDRLKLRARAYDEHGDVSLEIKRKRGDVVWKQRALVPRDGLMDAAAGFGRTRLGSARQEEVLERFAHTFALFGAEPKLMVEYEREAYASQVDAYARVTFDRRITAYALDTFSFSKDDAIAQVPLDTRIDERRESLAVLELKAELFVPDWMIRLIHDLELERVSYSKYNAAVRATLGSLWVGDPMHQGLEHA